MATIECCGFITVLCDNPDCERGHVVPCCGTRRRARQAAREAGWVRKWVRRLPQGSVLMDLCPGGSREAEDAE